MYIRVMYMHTKLSLPNSCLEFIPSLDREHYREADLHGNRLCTLDGLPQTLLSLDMSENKIDQEGFFFPFPSLETLNLCQNEINIFDEEEFVLCFPSLKHLNLAQNKLRHTAFLRSSEVKDLNVRSNRIAVLSGLPSPVKRVIADTNSITMIQSKLPPSLEYLEASYNLLRFAGLPLNWPSTLRELHLNHNSIESFPRKLPDTLEILSLNHNQIITIPSSLPSSLKILCCNGNRIRQCPPFRPNRFHILLLDNNCLFHLLDESVAKHFSAENNWNTIHHHQAQMKIKQCWKRYVFTLRLRHYRRTQKTKEELFIISMMPERWEQIDTIDPIWFRKGPNRSRIDHHLD
jgi:Leucine-rich repeat (LRR) protein